MDICIFMFHQQWDFIGFNGLHPLANYQKSWAITIFNWTTHYFDWAIFNSYVKLPEGSGI